MLPCGRSSIGEGEDLVGDPALCYLIFSSPQIPRGMLTGMCVPYLYCPGKNTEAPVDAK